MGIVQATKMLQYGQMVQTLPENKTRKICWALR